LRYHGLGRPDENHPAVARLKNLESQYTCKIGVGSVLQPANCEPAHGESLLYISDTAGHTPGLQEKQKKACHVRDQSTVRVVLDTGSTNIWIASDLCQSGPCALPGRSRYNHTVSRTFRQPDDSNTLQIEFGTGKLSGTKAVDDIHVGPFTVYKQTFGMIAEEQGRVWEEVPFEGILGLAFKAMAASGIVPFMDGIIENKAIGKNEFAFYFSRDSAPGNAVFWGGVDHAFYKGEIEYFPVVEPYYWALELVDFKIGEESKLRMLLPEDGVWDPGKGESEKTEHPTFKALVDSGTTFFTAQGALFNEIKSKLPASQCDSITDESHPPITYTLKSASGENRDFRLTNKQYMVSSNPNGAGASCSLAFMPIEVPKAHGPGMVLGEVFLRIYFSVFDRGDTGDAEEARIGLALADHGPKAQRRLKELAGDD